MNNSVGEDGQTGGERERGGGKGGPLGVACTAAHFLR
jgi:hypothetical protein